MNQEDIWQIDAGGQIYVASFEELKQWVAEGAVLPSDKIRRGNLRWLEAGKVPLLNGAFNAKSADIASQTQTTVTNITPTSNTQINTFANAVPNEQPTEVPWQQTFVDVPQGEQFTQFSSPQSFSNFAPNEQPLKVAPTEIFADATPVEQIHTPVPPQQVKTPPTPYSTEVKQTNQTQTHPPKSLQTNVHANQNECSIHFGTEAKYVCVSCEDLFCRSCPKAYGEVRICPNCGEMCKSLVEVQQKKQRQTHYQNAISDGFGFSDFTNALAYPFKHSTSLLIGGVIFAVFSIGQSALNLGALYVAAGGVIGMMLSNMIAFACLSNTINEFSKGNLTANFMPSFDDFNLWDDVVHPFFLSIGVYLVSFGLLILIVAGGAYMALSSIKQQMNPMMNLPVASSQNVSSTQPTMNSFDDLMKKDAEQKAKMAELKNGIYPSQTAANTMPQTSVNKQLPTQFTQQDTEKSVAMAEKMISDLRKSEAESVLGPSPETQQMEQQMMFATLMQYGFGFIMLAFIGLLWALFYYPAACLVAGYTRSFTAVINPLVGLDTIKRLGFSYVKILLMEVLLSIILAVIMGIVAAVLSPFDLPKIGNIPATLITSFLSFYYYIVFAAVLGYAMYKSKNLLNN
jgi:hypothetical protein